MPSDAQYVLGFDKYGRIKYDWPEKLGFDEKTITAITKENGLPEVWDRYGRMSGGDFSDVPETGRYTYSQRAIPYLENEAAYHKGMFNTETYFDKIDAIRDGDMGKLNKILEKEGVTTVDQKAFNELSDSYQKYLKETRMSIGEGVDVTYGLKGKAASWGDMQGGAGQFVTPLNGENLKEIGIIIF